MAKRDDIIEWSEANTNLGGLIYTKKCGWIDLGHAQPSGARRLYDKVCANTHKASTEKRLKERLFMEDFNSASSAGELIVRDVQNKLPLPTINKSSSPSLQNKLDKIKNQFGGKYYLVQYKQQMKKTIFKIRGTKSFYGLFAIKKDLNDMQKKAVALAIFMKVSLGFESMQQRFEFATDSGFSAEDLVSNLLGFYRAINQGINYIPLCEPVSKEEALYVWDTYGAVGSNKNYGFCPYLFPTSKDDKLTPHLGFLPYFLNEIKPAIEGELFATITTWG